MNRLLWFVLGVIGAAVVLLMLNDSAGYTIGLENGDFSRLVWLGLLATRPVLQRALSEPIAMME